MPDQPTDATHEPLTVDASFLTFRHKGYTGVVDCVDEQCDTLSGSVRGTEVITYFEGRTVRDAKASFVTIVENLIEMADDQKRQEVHVTVPIAAG